MNWFVLINGILYLAGAVWSLAKGNPAWSFVWLCYGASALVLAWLEK